MIPSIGHLTLVVAGALLVVFAAERFGLITEKDGTRCAPDDESLEQVRAALQQPAVSPEGGPE